MRRKPLFPLPKDLASEKPLRNKGPQAYSVLTINGIVDGAPWICTQVEYQNLPLDALGLDFYHLAENVHKTRRSVYGEVSEAGRVWAEDVLRAFKHEGYAVAWEKLVTWRGGHRGGKRVAADGLLNYVSERRAMIQYPEFGKKGWQIGSGPTESCCKTLTQRLKGWGDAKGRR